MVQFPEIDPPFNLLIVDDMLDNLQLLAEMLSTAGYNIRRTTSGKLALQFAQLQQPDLILLDVCMPDLDGYQVCHQLKQAESTRDIPVIFISALDQLDDKVKGFEAGGIDYITKPFQEGEVLIRVKTQLELQAQRRQLLAQNRQLEQEIAQRRLAEQALKEQIARERLLGKVIQQVRQSLDLEQILTTTVTEARQLLQTDRALVYRAEPDQAGTIVSESDAPGVARLQEQTLPDDIFPKEHHALYLRGRIRTVVNIDQDSMAACLKETLRQFGVQSKLVAPIVIHRSTVGARADELWGLLVFHQCHTEREWRSRDIELVRQLADQVAIAIQQSELYQQVQSLNANLGQQVEERTKQLQQSLHFESLLKDITDRVRDSLDEQQIWQTAVETLCKALQLECCDAGIYNAELTASTVAYEHTLTLPSALGITFEFANDNLPGMREQLLRGEPFQHPYIESPESRLLPHRCNILACPIYDDQGVLGDLWLFRESPASFDPTEVRLVQQVANQCAIALRQSRLYQAAQAQVQELERLNQLKDDFLSTVSHELRSPMASIKMAIQLLEINLEPLGIFEDEENLVHRYFKVLQEETQREISLINDLLDMTRIDAATEPLNLNSIGLYYFIPQLAEPFLERIRQQHQQLEVDIPDTLPYLTTDLGYLERILTELLHNACKYTPAGETIQITARALEVGLEIRVSNSGVEIPEGERELIFDKFYRIPNHDPWKHGGTGLGLALVKKLAEYLDATIRVESGGGKTTFVLEFQAVAPNRESLRSQVS